MLGLSGFIEDLFESATTSAGAADGTTVVDTALQAFGLDGLSGGWIRSREGTTINEVRRVTGFSGSTATVAPPFSAQIASGISYEYHRYDPRRKFAALDEGRLLAFPQLAVLNFDETLTADGVNSEITIPSTMRKGPMQVFAETPLGDNEDWQLLSNGALTSTTSWTATGSAVASTYTRLAFDRLIPKTGTSCVKIVGSGALTQVVANMRTGVSASLAAGRNVSFGAWVYSRTAGPTVSITDDSAAGTSSAHLGLGWQFLQVTREVVTLNATTLTVAINTTANITVYAQGAQCGFLDSIPLVYGEYIARSGVRRDNATQKVLLAFPPDAGLQLRLIGRTPLTALGTSVTAQLTNAMEVDELNAGLLYAMAARVLFTWEGWSTDRIEALPKIQMAAMRFAEQEETARVKYPMHGRLTV